MPISFLDLPREIRDIIYEEVLISPTGNVEPFPIPRSDKSFTPSNGRFSLDVVRDLQGRFRKGTVTPAQLAFDSIPVIGSKPKQKSSSPARLSPDDEAALGGGPKTLAISLSLVRTCRQIHQETRHLFWTRNTLAFEYPYRVIATLKTIGQTASRLLTSIACCVSNKSWRELPKLFGLLASRARQGCFRTLRLDIQKYQYIYWRHSNEVIPGSVYCYDAILEVLREASTECKFERTMSVETSRLTTGLEHKLDYDMVRDLHLAWGGTMFVNGKPEWKDYIRLDNSIGRP